MTIQDDVNRLYRAGAKRIVLKEIPQRPPITQTVGFGKYPVKANDTVPAAVRTEVITVYSRIIITEDGAFERPHGWPSDGAYPAGTAIPSPLPNSLINDAGVLKLDTNVQHYEQKRVHLVAFDGEDQLYEDHYLIPLAAPYAADGYYQGIIDHASGPWSPDLFRVNATVGLSVAAAARIVELDGLGIGYE